LGDVQAKVDEFEGSTDTKTERDEIASIAHKVARTKTAVDAVGKDMVAGAKAEIKKVDAARKTARDTFDALKAEVRAPLTEWENTQKQSEEGLRLIVAKGNMPGETLEAMERTRRVLRDMNARAFCPRHEEAALEARTNAIEAVDEAIAIEKTRLAEVAELEQLRKEKAERLAAEAEAKRQAELDRRVQERVAEIEQAERDAAPENVPNETTQAAIDASRDGDVEPAASPEEAVEGGTGRRGDACADIMARVGLPAVDVGVLLDAIEAGKIRHVSIDW
ncbi:MAG: hypothetical protein ACTSX8_00765, partial [Alphaproteobacteria bacterium]